MLDPPTHNRPFADKRDKVGVDGVPYDKVCLKLLRYQCVLRSPHLNIFLLLALSRPIAFKGLLKAIEI